MSTQLVNHQVFPLLNWWGQRLHFGYL